MRISSDCIFSITFPVWGAEKLSWWCTFNIRHIPEKTGLRPTEDSIQCYPVIIATERDVTSRSIVIRFSFWFPMNPVKTECLHFEKDATFAIHFSLRRVRKSLRYESYEKRMAVGCGTFGVVSLDLSWSLYHYVVDSEKFS